MRITLIPFYLSLARITTGKLLQNSRTHLSKSQCVHRASFRTVKTNKLALATGIYIRALYNCRGASVFAALTKNSNLAKDACLYFITDLMDLYKLISVVCQDLIDVPMRDE